MLLLIDAAADVNVFLPSKVVDYLMLDKPIMALTPPEGATAAILGPARHLLVPPTDHNAMEQALRAVIDRHARGVPLADYDREAGAAYDVKATTRLFAGALDAAIERRRIT